MNERFKDLLPNPFAVDYQYKDGPLDLYTEKEMEKFAELIVWECIKQCSKALVEHTGQPSITHNYAVGLCQDNIKEHFGVE